MSEQRRTPARATGLVLVVTVVLSVLLAALRVPSPVLFAAVLGAMAHALTSSTPLALPSWAYRVAQGLIGITVGALVEVATLQRMASEAVPVAAVTAGTLVISILAGRLLALRRDVSATTGVFALVAGGASGVVAVARDLGADERVVTVVQYLRVLVVLLTMPLVTAVAFHPPSGRGSLTSGAAPLPADLLFVGLSLAIGPRSHGWSP